MGKNNIGLLTFYNNNYGSTLQCYAMKTIIEKHGYCCELLFEQQNYNETLLKKIQRRVLVLKKSVLYPGYLKSFLSMRNAMKTEQSYMTERSHEMLDRFITSSLCPAGYTWKELKSVGEDNNYKAFIVGSDQVWNASRLVTPFFFLEFAPVEKRHTYAVSFGVSSVPRWNKKNLSNGIKGFNRISVRENVGKDIAQEFTSVEVVQNIDPTMLLSGDEWRKFAERAEIPNDDYILVHFLNEPSELAIEWMNSLSQKTACKVKGFANSYANYSQVDNFDFVDGGPQEYIALIDNARYVLTDSFHTTIFSINLHTSFFVFHRQYLHGFPQTSRIVELLEKFGFTNRLITDLNNSEKDNCDFDNRVDNIIYQERKSGLEFIKQEIS